MAPAMPKQLAVFLPENEGVARAFLEKRRSMLEKFSDNHNHTLAKAYRSVCASKEPIRTLKDLKATKGVGKWVIRLMKESFPESSPDSSPSKSKTTGEKGKKTRGPKHHVPGPKPGKHAKYVLTEEGRDTAHDSLPRPGLYDPARPLTSTNSVNISTAHRNPDNLSVASIAETSLRTLMTISEPGTSVAVRSPEFACSYSSTTTSQELIQLTSKDQLSYSCDVPTTSNPLEKIVLSDSDSDEPYKGNTPLIGSELFTETNTLPKRKAQSSSSLDTCKGPITNFGVPDFSASIHSLSSQETFGTQSSSTMGTAECDMLEKDTEYMDNSVLAMPPGQSTEKFLEAYEVVLILDDRETFGSGLKRVAFNIQSKFHIPVEIKRLPVGDGIWIARHKELHSDYVLDFIVERKSVMDLLSSIKESRYKDQKLRLKVGRASNYTDWYIPHVRVRPVTFKGDSTDKCGLRKLIYLVEGDPNPLDASDSIKTACFTTEILDGFDVQRTADYSDTERTYAYLTHTITDYYNTNFSIRNNSSRVCPTYEEFVKKCCDLKKTHVSDIFALQLMQVPQVTEKIALAVTELYPTIFSLAQAYSMLDGDICAQEQMLKNKSKMVNAGASRNIFNLVWGEG